MKTCSTPAVGFISGAFAHFVARRLPCAVLALAGLFFCQLSLAQWSPRAKISHFQAETAGIYFQVTVSGTPVNYNIANCGNGTFLMLETSHPQFRSLNALLLAAFIARTDVIIYAPTCMAGNYYPSVSQAAGLAP